MQKKKKNEIEIVINLIKKEKKLSKYCCTYYNVSESICLSLDFFTTCEFFQAKLILKDVWEGKIKLAQIPKRCKETLTEYNNAASQRIRVRNIELSYKTPNNISQLLKHLACRQE